MRALTCSTELSVAPRNHAVGGADGDPFDRRVGGH
jgi:hypothetical protein